MSGYERSGIDGQDVLEINPVGSGYSSASAGMFNLRRKAYYLSKSGYQGAERRVSGSERRAFSGTERRAA